MPVKRVGKFFLKLLVTLVPAYFVWHNIAASSDLGKNLTEVFRDINLWWLVGASFALVLSHFLGAKQWNTLLVIQDVRMTYRKALKYYWTGLFFNNFMPGNVGGDLKRVVDVKMESGKGVNAGLSATLFDRLFGLFFLNALSLGVGVLFFIKDPRQSPILLPSFGVFMGFCLLFAALFSKRIGKFLERLLQVFFPAKFMKLFTTLRDSFHLFRQKELWIRITIYSACAQILRVSVHWFCGLAIGLDISVSWYFYYIPIVAVISALPISIGGFGPREYLAQTLFALAGVGVMDSVIVQLLAYLVSLVVSLWGAVEFLFIRSATTHADTSSPSLS